MNAKDQGIEMAARSLVAEYGDDASVVAIMRAAEYAATGDTEALRHWDAVIARIEMLGTNGPD